MAEKDEWGKDPSVRFMREVFKEMEKAQHDLLKRLKIAPYDLRIRGWRDRALALFERAWSVANRMGIPLDDHTASVLYVHCLAKVMGEEKIRVPADIMPDAKNVERILKLPALKGGASR
jgi:hypothetical protein